MSDQRLSALMFSKLLFSGAQNLFENRTIVNDLNVFPIPDGDTGDNMYMTISSGCSAVKDISPKSLDDMASKTAKGMLLGARGNSGVILSRIFAGIAKGLSGSYDADINTFSKALMCGVDESYKAVSKPVEGTILSVYKDAVTCANSKMHDDMTFEEYFTCFISGLKTSLEKTPDLLYVLKEAGVVDSGGAGMVYIAEGMRHAFNDNRTYETDNIESSVSPRKVQQTDLSKFNEDSELVYGYCTEFMLQLQNSKTENAQSFDDSVIKDYLNENGDSLVFFREGTVIRVHVHTKTPGDILNFCQKYGEFLTMKIENMTLQHNETTIQNNYSKPSVKAPKKRYGIISVASGKGIKDTFRELGCDEVIEGGQSMNPSAQDFIDAFDRINAETIFVFPNNSNIILTASQAASIYNEKDIRIIESRSIGQGYSAVSQLDTTNEDADALTEEIKENIADIKTGHITTATRDSHKDGIDIHKGDFLGICDDRILLSEKSLHDAVIKMCEKLEIEDCDIALLISGEETDENETHNITEELEAQYKYTEIIDLKGGQPVYSYIIILE